MLGELSSSLGKALSKRFMHFIEHNVGAVINFHSCEKYVGSFSHLFVLTQQGFKRTLSNFRVAITAVRFLILFYMRWSITDEVNEQSRCFMLELETPLQGTNHIFRLVTSSTGSGFLNFLLSSLDIFSVLKNIEVFLISFISEVPVANISNSYFGCDFGSLSDLVNEHHDILLALSDPR